jgi:YedE family putative selenium metabolism protein
MPLLSAGLVALILYLHYDFAVDIEGRLETKFAAPVMTALLIALGLGFLSQRSGYCSVGGYRDAILWRDYRLLWAYGIFTAALVGGNLLVDAVWPGSAPLFNWGAHPLAHSVHPWNYLGMVLVGLGSVLVGGCPFRQLIAAGQGNSDAAVTLMGLMFGAGVCHNFGLAAAPDGVPVPAGPPAAGQFAVVAGIATMFLIGLSSTARHEAGGDKASA